MKKTILAFALLAMLGLPLAASASTITGVLNVTGTVEISLGSIAFAGGQFSINSPASSQQGGFAALEGTMGGIDNITNPPDATGSLDVPDFITFAAAPNITITLTFLEPGVDGAAGCTSTPPAAGQICTPSVPAQSPLDLTNLSNASSVASFVISGTEWDSITGNSVPINGVFTIPLSNESFQGLLETIGTGGTVTSAFAAEFTTGAGTSSPPTMPEPGTLWMLVIGMMALVGLKSPRSIARKSTAS